MKKFFIYFSISIFLTMGLYSIVVATELSSTYNPRNTKVFELQKSPNNYTLEGAKGSSEIQTKINLEATGASNVVNAIIYEFRSFDSLLIVFLIITAIIGIEYVLGHNSRGRHGNEEENEI